MASNAMRAVTAAAQVQKLSIEAMLDEQACDNPRYVGALLRPAVPPRPPGVHMPAGFRPPPGLSLPSSPKAWAPCETRVEDPFERSSDCSTMDCQETMSQGMSTPSLSTSPLPTPTGDGSQLAELSVAGSVAAATLMDRLQAQLHDDLLAPPPPPGLPRAAPPGLHSETPGESAKQSLELSGAISMPSVGTPECPSVGSIGHRLGLCKPCDFVHRGTCRTGGACKYCHLCGPSEQRRRKKERQRCTRAMRDLQSSAPVGWQVAVQPAAVALGSGAFISDSSVNH